MTKELVKPEWMSDADWEDTLGKVESLDRIRRDAQEHLRIYASTDGQEGFERAAPCLLLTTIGRKSGKQITTPLNFWQQGDTYVVIGSLAGYDRDPGWALNLKKNPHAWVQIKEQRLEVTARVVTGAERERLWVRSNEVLPLWQVFQQRTEREFPIFVLTPKQ